MASQRFILLVNNMIVRDYDNSPIFEVQDRGKKYYHTVNNTTDSLEDRVDAFVEKVLAEEQSNPLIELVTQTETLKRYNQEFRIKMYITPLYELQLQLAQKPNATRIAGSTVDVASIWQEGLYNFYVLEFLKYTQIITHLEQMVKIRMHKNSPFSIKHGDQKVMSLVHLKVNGLYNPLDTVAGLKETKLFKQVYGDERLDSFSLDDPAVFPVDILRGSVSCYFATSSDVLALCNVKHKEAISSRDLYRLIAGIILKSLFAGSKEGGLHEGVLDFPISKTLYQMVDPTDGSVARYFEDFSAATAYGEEEGYQVQTLDTDANFIVTAFPSFRNKPITQETELLHQIRGAEFVY